MLKKIGLLLFIAILIGAIAFLYVNQASKNAASSKTDVRITASELFAAFDENETSANEEYLDKVIEIKGKISEIDGNQIRLQTEDAFFGVICELENIPDELPEVGQEIVLKGFCTGKLMDVVLTRCAVVD